MHSDFPSFLATQNHRDLYDELDGSNTPASIFRLIIAHTSSYILGGIGIFEVPKVYAESLVLVLLLVERSLLGNGHAPSHPMQTHPGEGS